VANSAQAYPYFHSIAIADLIARNSTEIKEKKKKGIKKNKESS